MTGPSGAVRLLLHLASSPEQVYQYLSTGDGRAAFWADSAVEKDGIVHFLFSSGAQHRGPVLAAVPPNLYAVEYFGGSRAEFEMAPDGHGGTVLTLTETGIPEQWHAEHRAGWVSVLLTLKAAVDFGVDLRNPDPARDWDAGYVDV